MTTKREAPDQQAVLALIPEELAGRSTLAERVADGLSRAQHRWPMIALEPPALVAALLPRWASGNPDPAGMDNEELYLALACANQDAEALSVLESEYLPILRQSLLRLLSESQLDDAMQRLREHLLIPMTQDEPARIAKFAGRGKLGGWLYVVAIRMVRRQLSRGRDERSDLAGEIFEVIADPSSDPETAFMKATYRDAFRTAFSRAIDELEQSQRTVLTLQFVDRLNAEEIARIHGVHRTTVIRWVARSQRLILERTRELLKVGLRLQSQELDSVVQLIQSNLQLTLSSFLK